MYLIGFYSKEKIHKLIQFDYYKKAFLDLKNKGVKTIYFYKEDIKILINNDDIKNINKMGIDIVSFDKEKDVINYLSKIKGKIFINTFEEQEIGLVNKIRKLLNQPMTDNPEIFLNKYLQRSIIGSVYPETVVDYKLLSIDDAKNITKDDLNKFPCIIKPNGGVQSSGVIKINNYNDYKNGLNNTLNALKKLKNKKLGNQEIIIEEFIDGDMYTITYYVDDKQNISLSKPVFIKLGFDYEIEDFCNVIRIISQKTEKMVDESKLNEFIKKTVIGGNIKNTFIHHDFKINSKGEFKTIETNGRIGGYRLNMYQLGYNINLLEFPFISEKRVYKLKNNIAIFVLYPKNDCIFNGFNQRIINDINKLKSFYSLNKVNKKIGEKIGLTKNGYEKLGSITIINDNAKQFEKDLKFIENIYFEIINTK